MKKLIMIMVAMPIVAFATTWYVDGTNGSDSYSGMSQSAAKKTIQAAIDASSDGDTILVDPGVYTHIETMNKSLMIQSVSGYVNTIIEGGDMSCAELRDDESKIDAKYSSTNTVLIGFTCRNGNGGVFGGKICNCVITNNTASGSGWSIVSDCLIANNRAPNGGGCIGSLVFSSTIVNNSATGLGGGTYGCSLNNCIVYGNSPDNVFNLSATYHAQELWARLGYSFGKAFTGNPLFADAETGNYCLAAESPCIDAGDNSYVVSETDLDGKARIVNGIVDIGCYEYVGGDPIVYRTVTFDGNGGVASAESRSVKNGAAVGELPTATREGYDFVGWFTAAVGGEQVSAETLVTADVTYFAQWKAQETDVPTYGPWGEGEDVANPDKLGPTYLEDMTLTINGAAGALGDVVAVYRTDTDAVCGLGKVLDDSGTLTAVCYASTGTKLHFKVWIAASGVVEPTVLDCDKKCDLVAPASGSFYSGHALVVSDDKELTLTLKNADWHTVSFNVVPDDPSPSAVFADVADRIAAVTQGVNYWMPGKAGTLKQIEVGKGYWVKTKSANVSWTVSGKTNPSVEIPLFAGWNLIGYAPEDEQAVASVLKTALAEKAIDYVTYGVSFYPNGTLAKMSPGKAYWVHAKKAYTLVYDEVKSEKLKVKSVMAAAGGALGERALPKLTTNNQQLTTPTYGPFGEGEDVANPDKLGPTMFTDVALAIDGEPAALGDCVAVYRGDTGALCGLGKVLETPGELAIVCYAPQGVALTFKAWVSVSGMAEPTVVVCTADTAVAPSSGEIVAEAVRLTASTQVPSYTVIAGAKCDVDVGLVGYKATGLPKGLTLNAKGHVTGTTKAEGEYEVTFTKKGEEDETAVFVVRKESAPTLECEALEAGSFTVGVAGAVGGMPIAISAESGVKSVTQKNLPTGMKLEQDKTTKQWRVTGAPTKAGPCKVKLTVTTVAGNKVEKEFEIAVATLPDMVVGTFNGFVSQRKQYDAEFGKPFGAIQVTTTDAGKITAKITAAAKTYSFSATCWDEVKDGVYSVNVTLKTGEALLLMLDSSAGWDGYQLTGRFSFAGTPSDGSYYELSAQRNAFGKTWYFDVEGSEADGWRFSYADNPKTAALTLSLNADGKTSIAGKLGDLRVSASGYSDVSEMRNGCVIADFAPVVTVMDNKKSVKMLLAIRTNLWFDRSNDHELIGSAELVR